MAECHAVQITHLVLMELCLCGYQGTGERYVETVLQEASEMVRANADVRSVEGRSVEVSERTYSPFEYLGLYREQHRRSVTNMRLAERLSTNQQ